MTNTGKVALWQQRFEDQAQSQLTIASWCQQNQIVLSKFYYWKKKLSHSQESPESQLVPLSFEPTASCALTIETPQGYRITVSDPSALAILPSLLQVLQ